MRAVVESHRFDPGFSNPHVIVELHVCRDRGEGIGLGGNIEIRAALDEAPLKWPLGKVVNIEIG